MFSDYLDIVTMEKFRTNLFALVILWVSSGTLVGQNPDSVSGASLLFASHGISRYTTDAEIRGLELVFVDNSVTGYEQLVADLKTPFAAARSFEAYVITPAQDGLLRISEVLARHQGIKAVHIISHGNGRAVKLGNHWITADKLDSYRWVLHGWSNSLTNDADLLFYSCKLAGSETGLDILATFARQTGADVAASDDNTGSHVLGGDWELEYSLGNVEATVAFTCELQEKWEGLLSTFIVTNTSNSGAGSLRQAILDANANAGPDVISFNIPGPGVHKIFVTSALPAITDLVTLDGWTEPDYISTPVVRIDGASAGSVSGLMFSNTSDGSMVRGLMITRFTGNGINIDPGADDIKIAGNWIGTTGTGSTGVGNGNTGINVQGANTAIGGTGANDRNVITNNGNEGINLTGSGATGILIRGNYIGLDPDGSAGSGNTDVGISLLAGANMTTIGGTTGAERNVISKNSEGIEINSNNNVVQGNYIGTDATGTFNRGNRSDDGVEIQNGATGNLIGGTLGGAGNLIAFNALNGVNVVSGTNNAILRNQIHSNTGLGIDLSANGVTANDIDDSDAGPNNLQNTIELNYAQTNGSILNVFFTYNGAASSTFNVDFYASTSPDASGFGEGERYLFSSSITTGATGTWSGWLSTSTSGAVVGDYISSLVTNSTSNTSEFSQAVRAEPVNRLYVNTTSDIADGNTATIQGLLANKGTDGYISLREAITAVNNTVNGATPDEIHFNIAGVAPHTINVLSAPPIITGSVILDATTEPDFAGTPIIELNGTSAGVSAGLVLSADNCTIRGLVINRFGSAGIVINGDNNTIAGNFIGTDVTGTLDMGNANTGISISASASGNLIGGTVATDRNVISANNSDGIYLGTNASNNVITGNFIGTTVAGTESLGNKSENITIDGALGTRIGGLAAGAGNVICAASQEGIWIINGTTGTIIRGNYIGTDITGTIDLGNGDSGIGIGNMGVASSNNITGGTVAGARNIIAFNRRSGIVVDKSTSGSSVDNAVLGNAIYGNAGLGIDLDDIYASPASPGVTANDPGDNDTGGNNRQNFPVLVSATATGSQVTITGSLNSTAGSTFRIEFFSSTAGDVTGYGEGQLYLGYTSVTTDGSGNAAINTTLSGVSAGVGDVITATATVDLGSGSYGNSSEFSANITATPTIGPGGVAGAAVWYKADQGVTTGSTLTWTDQSGNNRNGVQAIPANQPSVVSSVFNFNPGLLFNGTTHRLDIQNLTGFPTGAGPIQQFGVGNSLNVGGTYQSIFSYGTAAFAQMQGIGKTSGNANAYTSTYGSNAVSSALEFTSALPVLIEGKYTGTQVITSTFGLQRAVSGLIENKTISTGNIGSSPGPQDYWNGNISEIIMYSTNLTATQTLQVNSYLAIKYGITIDQTSAQKYLASDGTTNYWNGTTNSGYKNNIAGIARDDNSALNQKQSKSVNVGLQIVIGNGNTIAADNVSNANNFSADKSALVWGDNAGSVAAWKTTGAPTGRQIIARTWKVQETGTIGSVKVQIADNGGINGLPVEKSTVYLLVDADGNFAVGTSEVIMTLIGTNWEANVNLTTGQFFTFATELPVGIIVFGLGSTSTRCQGAGSVAYTATATNTTGITYSLDAASMAGGNSIVPETGEVTYVAGWIGTTIVTATAAGVGGPITSTHTVIITPTVGIPTAITISSGTEPNCQLTNGTTTTSFASTASNSTGFNWSLSNGSAGSIDAVTGIMTWANGFSGTVDIRVTANGCNGPSASASRTVIVQPDLTINDDAPSLLCQYNIQMVTATPGEGSGNYTYSWQVITPGATALFVPGAATNNFIWLTSYSLVPGTYEYMLTVTDAGTGCQKVKNYSVIIQPNLDTTWGLHPSSVCINQNGVVYTVPSLNETVYMWSVTGGTIASGQGTASISVNWGETAGPGNVSVNTVTGSCTQTLNQTVMINSLPTIALGSDPAVCIGLTSASLTYSATTGSPDRYSIIFNAMAKAAGFTDLTDTTLTNTPILIPLPGTDAGTYNGNLTVKISSTGCSSFDYPISVTIAPTVGTPVFTLGTTSTRCPGAGSVTYTATTTNTTGITYILDAASIAGGNSIVAGTGAVTYVSGWSGISIITASVDGCNGPKTTTHTVNMSDVTDPVVTCPGDRTEDLNDNCEFIIPDYITSVTVYDNCDPAPSLNQFPVAGTVLYGDGTLQPVTITSTDISGNTSSCIFNIILHDNTAPVVACLPDTIVTFGEGVYKTEVILPAPLASDNCGIKSVINDFNGEENATGIYSVGKTVVNYTVTDVNGNSTQCSQQITIRTNEEFPFGLLIPQGFSPNNDGLNDTFEILGLEAYPENELFVYNVWGYEVYNMHGYDNRWDGTVSEGVSSDRKLPTGTYYYILKLGNEQVVKGFVYLIMD